MARTRIVHRLACLAMLTLSTASASAATSPYDQVASLGVGTLSCALWLRTPTNEHIGAQWIYGFFTGINTYGTRRGSVGAMDHQEVVEEVRRLCQGKPSLQLQSAAGRAYNLLLMQGR